MDTYGTAMSSYLKQEQKRRTKTWVFIILLAAAMLFLSVKLMDPAPPNELVLATGNPGGAYAAYGALYSERLGELGLKVNVANTGGSLDNLRLLLEEKAQVAFVQAGTYSAELDPDGKLCGLAAIYLEPLWVFYRGEEEVDRLGEFEGKKISIGAPGSGTDCLARQLLERNGIDASNSDLINHSMAEAAEELKKGLVEAAFFVSSPRSEVVQELVELDDTRLMNFRRHVAYSRIMPSLTVLELPEGVLNLENNTPPTPVTLLAPAALLVGRRDLHPQVVEQVLKVALELHAGDTMLDPEEHFPSLKGVELPIHETAESYMDSGESFLSRLLPYWGVRFLLRSKVFWLPLLTLLLPFFKLAPSLYRFRVNRLLKRHYAALREVESSLELAESPDELRRRLCILENMRNDMERVSRKVPAHLQRDVYNWRLHISLVRAEALARLEQLEGSPPSGGKARDTVRLTRTLPEASGESEPRA